jgi:hypothetical protein
MDWNDRTQLRSQKSNRSSNAMSLIIELVILFIIWYEKLSSFIHILVQDSAGNHELEKCNAQVYDEGGGRLMSKIGAETDIHGDAHK